MKMMTVGMGLDCWEWEAHESSHLWWWWCLQLAIFLPNCFCCCTSTQEHLTHFLPKDAKKIQRCHVLGYGGPLKFFKFGWLLGLCLATKLYTHRGVTLLNYKDPPSHLSSNFEIHMPPFGSIPKGGTMNKWEHIIQNHLRILFNLKSKPKWVSYCKSTHVANYYPFSTTTFPMLKQKLI